MSKKTGGALATDAVVSSASQRRLVVAGPGTGKTFLFQELVKAACCDPQQVLVLTFINNLKADLEKALTTTANVRTLHGYCHSLLRINGDLRDGLSREFFYFPNVPSLIKRDWELKYGDEAPQFIGLCRRLERGDETDFYIRRSSYYDAVSFDDSVFRVHERLARALEHLPSYSLVLIDEYQDFNRLEAEFIGLLATTSPIVIAGDDDQALYTQPRGSSPEFIRELHAGTSFETFRLPFCMLCTEVVVSAVDSIISRARKPRWTPKTGHRSTAENRPPRVAS